MKKLFNLLSVVLLSMPLLTGCVVAGQYPVNTNTYDTPPPIPVTPITASESSVSSPRVDFIWMLNPFFSWNWFHHQSNYRQGHKKSFHAHH